MARPKESKNKKASSELLLEAAMNLIRIKGYAATTVEDICEKAGVSKGTFFHNFSSKENLAISTANFWTKVTSDFFRLAPYHQYLDPLDRVIGYVHFRKHILQGELQEFTCLAGTLVQEIYATHPDINQACFQSIFNHAETLESDIAAAKTLYDPKAKWTSKSLALHTQAVLQGSFILAKSSGDVKVAADSIDHLEKYIHLLFKK